MLLFYHHYKLMHQHHDDTFKPNNATQCTHGMQDLEHKKTHGVKLETTTVQKHRKTRGKRKKNCREHELRLYSELRS